MVSLRKRLLVAEVREGLSAWIGDYDKMPLPDAGGGGQHSSVWFSNGRGRHHPHLLVAGCEIIRTVGGEPSEV